MNEDSIYNNDPEIQERSRISNIAIGFLLVVAAFLAYNFFRTDPGTTQTKDTSPKSETAVESVVTGELGEYIDEETGLDSSDLTEELAENEYRVQEGDTLWKIAENELNDGFRWQEIASANDMDEATKLEVGSVINLPEVDTTDDLAIGAPLDDNTLLVDDDTSADGIENSSGEDTVATEDNDVLAATDDELGETPETAIGDETYVVQKGDTLWKVAQDFYGDGNMWKVIFDYEGNNLSMYTSKDGTVYPIIHSGNVLVIPAVE